MEFSSSIDIDAGEVIKSITLIGARLENLPLRLLAEDVKTSVDDVIQAEGAVEGGTRWNPLRASTIRRNPRRQGGRMLQATGLLANLQTFVGGNYFGVRSPAPYAGYHVTGTKHMAKRDFFAVNMEALLERISNELTTQVVR